MFAVIGLLTIFCLVSIVNEYRKNPVHLEGRATSADFEKVWHQPTSTDNKLEYKLPILEDSREFVLSSFPNNWDPESSNSSFQFAFLYHESRVGKSYAVQHYNDYLQKKRLTSIYINIKTPNTDPTQLAIQLRVTSLNDFDDIVEKSNRNDQVPVIFVDNIQNAFLQDVQGFSCQVCTYFRSLYETRKVNIIFISNDAKAREALQISQPYTNKMNFFNFAERNHSVILQYLQEKINPLIPNEEKRFISENTEKLIASLGWSFEHLNHYIKYIESFEGVQDFITKYTIGEAKRLSATNYIELLKCIVRSHNDSGWTSYGVIRKNCDVSPSKKLDEALENNVLEKRNNFYRPRNILVQNAIQLVQE